MTARSGGQKELEKFLLEQCKQQCEFAANEVYEAINFFLAQYYSEYTPKRYSREKDFLNSAFKTTVKRSGNGYVSEVGIDYESLDSYENATGFQVVSWANNALHGGYDTGTNTHVWNDAMDATINSGQLLADCITFLKGKGFTIVG
jgi:hypothetical protein